MRNMEVQTVNGKARQKGTWFLILVGAWYFFLFSPLFAGQSLVLRVPLRFFPGHKGSAPLEKGDLQLYINGQPREILDLAAEEKSLGVVPDLGRTFVLSFQMTGYGKKLERGVSQFLSDMLTPRDRLIVLSPEKIYRFNVSPDKEELTREIMDLLKQDFNRFNKRRTAMETMMLERTRELNRCLQNPFVRLGPFFSVLYFLDNFAPEFLSYKRQFLLPPIDKYSQVVDTFGCREGERWWIHFQQYDLDTMIIPIRRAFRGINRYMTNTHNWDGRALSHSLKKKYDRLKHQLLLQEDFAPEKLLEIFLKSKVSYINLFLEQAAAVETGSTRHNPLTRDMEAMLDSVALQSGGTSSRLRNVTRSLLEISNHVDRYYDLVFEYNGTLEAKNIQVKQGMVGGNRAPVYKSSFTLDEIQNMIGCLSAAKVTISDFSLDGERKNKVRFTLASFRLKRENGDAYGLLEVGIALRDPQGLEVYKSKNTLRASREELTLSIPLPQKHSGSFQLSIDVVDLLANTRALLKRDIVIL